MQHRSFAFAGLMATGIVLLMWGTFGMAAGSTEQTVVRSVAVALMIASLILLVRSSRP
jgi:hypothetical protein